LRIGDCTLFSLAKILIPIDFSERCLGATRFAIALAERFNSEIVLLHVLLPHDDAHNPDFDGANLRDLIEARRAKAKKRLEDFLSAALHHLRVKRMLLEGDPAVRIVEWAAREQPDLIMMPTHGYGPFRRLLLGSVTAKVLHDTDRLVWTGVHLAQGPPAEWGNLAHIACAIDLGSSSERVLEWASKLAKEFKSSLFLIHVVPRLDSPGEGHYSDEYHQKVAGEANRSIAQLQARLGTHADIALEAGEVPQTVCSTAGRVHADLLVIGRGSTSAPRLLPHAYNIIRESPCPVVSV
jgi:nucleotide-binding universal stress UspA family protein